MPILHSPHALRSFFPGHASHSSLCFSTPNITKDTSNVTAYILKNSTYRTWCWLSLFKKKKRGEKALCS